MSTIYALDLETDTKEGDGLNPTNPLTRITSAAIYFGPDAEALAAGTGSARDEGSLVFDDPCEGRLLRSLDEWLLDADTTPGLIVTWNGARFDIAFLITRSEYRGVALGLDAHVHPARKPKYEPTIGHEGGYVASWGGHDHADIMHAYRDVAKAAGIRQGLKPVAKHYGLNPIEVEREAMEKLSVPERCAYNISDVEATYRLALLVEDIGPFRDSNAPAVVA